MGLFRYDFHKANVKLINRFQEVYLKSLPLIVEENWCIFSEPVQFLDERKRFATEQERFQDDV